MNYVDLILVAVIGLIICAAAFAIYKSKKSGKKCIGCPDSAACSGHCTGCTSRSCGNDAH